MSVESVASSRPRRASLEDVARLAGVSIATASRALHGTGKVREPTGAKVEAAASALGYRANLAAQTMARGTSPTVGVLVVDLTDSLSASIADGAVHEAADRGLLATVASTTRDRRDSTAHAVARLCSQHPRAIIVQAQAWGDDPAVRSAALRSLADYQAEGGRVVVVGDVVEPFESSIIDEGPGVAELVGALLTRGYRLPVILFSRGTVTENRAGALRNAFAASDVDAVMVDGAENRNGAYAAVTEMGGDISRTFDVICCVTDAAAIGASSALRAMGLTPGKDVGVTGFGGGDYARDVRPRITTVDLHQAAIGRAAIQQALDPDAVSTLVARVRVAESTPPRRPLT